MSEVGVRSALEVVTPSRYTESSHRVVTPSRHTEPLHRVVTPSRYTESLHRVVTPSRYTKPLHRVVTQSRNIESLHRVVDSLHRVVNSLQRVVTPSHHNESSHRVVTPSRHTESLHRVVTSSRYTESLHPPELVVCDDVCHGQRLGERVLYGPQRAAVASLRLRQLPDHLHSLRFFNVPGQRLSEGRGVRLHSVCQRGGGSNGPPSPVQIPPPLRHSASVRGEGVRLHSVCQRGGVRWTSFTRSDSSTSPALSVCQKQGVVSMW